MTVMNYGDQVSTASTTKLPGVKSGSTFKRTFPVGNLSRAVAEDPQLEAARRDYLFNSSVG
jgi:hypothetical protein